MFKFPSFLLPNNLEQPMHDAQLISPTELPSLNLAGTFSLHTVIVGMVDPGSSNFALFALALSLSPLRSQFRITGKASWQVISGVCLQSCGFNI